MDSTTDIFSEAMFDVYQTLNKKNGFELMDYLSKTNELSAANSGAVSENDMNFMFDTTSFTTPQTAFQPVQPQQQQLQNNTVLNEFTSVDLFPNDDIYTVANTEPASIYNSNMLTAVENSQPEAKDDPSSSPHSSLASTMDINSIFSYELKSNQFSEVNYNATRNNSITSLTSLTSPLDKISGEMQEMKPRAISTSELTYNSGAAAAYNNDSTRAKRHSDSRLSLNELSNFLHLGVNVKETAKREQEILTIFKDELGFELGLKTWVRDTSTEKRQQLVSDLTQIVESRYHYGYNEKIIEVIIRRASYYTMQGRLRRERRVEQKTKGTKVEKSNRRNRRN